MKVYGGQLFKKGKSYRVIIAAETGIQAAGIIGISKGNFYSYYCQTENNIELKKALSEPYTIFYCVNEVKQIFKKEL